MAKQKRKKIPSKSSKKKAPAYTLKAKDRRFLEMLAVIIEENRKAKVRPDSENAISEMVFGERTLVSKIKNVKRGISKTMMQKFAEYFNINPDAFFQDTIAIDYNPQHIKGRVSGKGIINTGTLTQVKGDQHTGEGNIYKGTVYKGNKIGKIIQKAERIINTSFDGENRAFWEDMMGGIKAETQTLEATVIRQHEDIKKMEVLHQTQLQTEIEKRLQAERERDEAREEERKTLKKYLALLEKKGLQE